MSCHEAVDGASLGSTWQLLKLIAAESQKRLCSRDWLDMEKLYYSERSLPPFLSMLPGQIRNPLPIYKLDLL